MEAIQKIKKSKFIKLNQNIMFPSYKKSKGLFGISWLIIGIGAVALYSFKVFEGSTWYPQFLKDSKFLKF